MQYRRKSAEVDAIQFDGTNRDEVVRFAGLAAKVTGRTSIVMLKTSDGWVQLLAGDWVTRDADGRFDRHHPDDFAATFDLIEG
jgi:hypothetical protein